MRKINGTFCIERTTLRRLQGFSKKSGIPQSQLVERMVVEGLNHLERRWQSPDDILHEAFDAIGKQKRRRRA
jgi:hypothetical protein